RCCSQSGTDMRTGIVGVEDVGVVFRSAIEHAAGDGIAFVGELLVGHPLLYVIGFADKDEQRLVLRLPAKAGHSAVVATAVQLSTDSQRDLGRVIGRQVGLQRSVGRVFNQARAEQGSGNAEDDVALGQLGGKVRLRQIATRCVGAPFDRVQIMHAAV